jgi:predicted Rossmann-fold nucleotide-binding protein
LAIGYAAVIIFALSIAFFGDKITAHGKKWYQSDHNGLLLFGGGVGTLEEIIIGNK